MVYEFKLPDLGEGLTEGEVARWLVAEGQEIAEDDPLVEVATDKTTVEISSPAAGTVSRILVPEGEVVPVGTVLVVIGGDGTAGEPGEPPSAPDAEAEREPATGEPTPTTPNSTVLRGKGARVRATPLVRRVAAELGVELDSVRGTGPQGRITEEDVRRAGSPAAAAPGDAAPVPPAPAPPAAAPGGAGPPPEEGRRVAIRGVRRRIVEHLTVSHREIPAVTWVEECDFGAVDLKRIVPVVLRSAALALREFPELNARLEGEEIVLLDRRDLGVAIQTDEGLVVPVVRGCDVRPLEELEADVERLAAAARAGTLAPAELRGSTFTVTSAGKLGGLVVTPLINHPEVGILGIHRIAERPVVRDGEVVVRRTGNVSVTFDHRVVDGARAAEFGLAVIARLESGEP